MGFEFCDVVGFQHTAARRRLGRRLGHGVGRDMFQHTAARRRLAIRLATTIRHIRFQHTAARRRLDSKMGGSDGNGKFQHTAARRRLGGTQQQRCKRRQFQHTAARRRLVSQPSRPRLTNRVSTHSRPKAAGRLASLHACTPACFNTQPPEGGWPFLPTYHKRVSCFNTQPPEGGWYSGTAYLCSPNYVSTHSRPKAAGKHCFILHKRFEVSTHSRPKAAGDRPDNPCCTLCSFNTQPPEGGWGSRGLRFGS